ncbi:YchJ family protein [Legionella jamestowniensis]|uniref:Preprotein translocase subunit SecA n=1 Tax=Legionella jamestowniensis TaxID=455 RepID=A0A0W0UGR6_9GAMM|nr:YchJ family protein [Legionella jamestowniensis]KTD07039.1 putative SEC-C motif domain protein [Legionella jamestowniensis]OCH96732.1 preprotein translocase subunit SecA [Legionella jamestowniensis]SFM03396.1 SEC-C motif-containing protein [Legionella jamestowniensis DSM 19215]
MNPCPCGSTKDYLLCCGRYINGAATPTTPEALMRSRYTAYSQANIDYIQKTMLGGPLAGFDAVDAKNWAARITWLGLKIIKAYQDESNPNKGYVEFIARFRENNQPQVLHELSQFESVNGLWFYTAGLKPEKLTLKSKVSRNTLCPCGSQKKFKNCCLGK